MWWFIQKIVDGSFEKLDGSFKNYWWFIRKLDGSFNGSYKNWMVHLKIIDGSYNYWKFIQKLQQVKSKCYWPRFAELFQQLASLTLHAQKNSSF